MAILPVTHATYDEFTAQQGLILTNFWSTSCGPCLRFRRIYRDPTPRPESGTFSTVPDAPRFLEVMYHQAEFISFVRSLLDPH